MTVIEILLSIITVISFGLALFSFVKNYITKTKEQAKVEVLKERLKHLNSGLESLFQAANAMVQIPKNREVNVKEIQDISRILRSQIYLLSEETKKEWIRLNEWKFGVMLYSKPPDSDSKERPPDNKELN